MNAYREIVSEERIQNDITDQAIHFMRENIHRKVTLQSISTFIGYSTSHFSALFLRKTGFSPLNYLNQLKIQEACHLLDFTDMKINQISMSVGFDDPFYFSRIFSKTMGTSPIKYRTNIKG